MKKIVLCYDFDKTLTKEDMLDYGLCKILNVEPAVFWDMEKELIKNQNLKQILSSMFLSIKLSKEKKYKLSKQNIYNFGNNIEFFDGVETWFEMINEYAKQHDIQLVHYVISGGLVNSIEGSSIFKYFKKVYACKFLFDENDNAIWPASIVDETNKPYYLKKIANEEKVEFEDMVYFGDGGTDIPAFEYLASNKGTSIGVQHPQKVKLSTLNEMLKKKTLHYYFVADFTKESELTKTLQQIIINKK